MGEEALTTGEGSGGRVSRSRSTRGQASNAPRAAAPTASWVDAIGALWVDSPPPSDLPALVAAARAAIPGLVDQVATDIRAQVSAYVDADHGEQHRVIAEAVT